LQAGICGILQSGFDVEEDPVALASFSNCFIMIGDDVLEDPVGDVDDVSTVGAVGGNAFRGNREVPLTDTSKESLITENSDLRNKLEKVRRELVASVDAGRQADEKSRVVHGTMITYLGLLAQFSDESVRLGVIGDTFVDPDVTSKVMKSVDIFREILLPSPVVAGVNHSARLDFFGKLLSRSCAEPLDFKADYLPYRMSFARWRDLFEDWLNRRDWMESDFGVKQVGQVNQGINSGGSRRKKKDSSAASSVRRKKTSDDWVRALQSLTCKKEILPPMPFHTGKGPTMEEFLKNYERYFEAKFDGSETEKAAYLERFLEGSAKSAFTALGGSDMRYDRLKSKLVAWYVGQSVDQRSKKRRAFRHAAMKTGESSAIYCLRLEKLAKRAFGDSAEEMEYQLKRKFRETVPVNLKQQIDTAESILGVTEDEPLTWKRIKKMAGQYDRKKYDECKGSETEEEQPVALMYSGDELTRGRNYGNGLGENVRFSSTSPLKGSYERPKSSDRWESRSSFQNTQRSSNVTRPRRITCENCGKEGHDQRSCWGKQNRCFVCGSLDHWKINCPVSEDRWRQHHGEHRSPVRSRGFERSTPHRDTLNTRALGRTSNAQGW